MWGITADDLHDQQELTFENEWQSRFFKLSLRAFNGRNFFYIVYDKPKKCTKKYFSKYTTISKSGMKWLKRRMIKMENYILYRVRAVSSLIEELSWIGLEQGIICDWKASLEPGELGLLIGPIDVLLSNYDAKRKLWKYHVDLGMLEIEDLKDTLQQTVDEVKRRNKRDLDRMIRKHWPKILIPMDVLAIIVDYSFERNFKKIQ